MNRVCPECGKTTEWVTITQEEEFNVKGEAILVKVELLKCSECEAEFEDMNSENDPYALAYEEYRKRKGMVFPAQIVEFRKKYNLTQKELSSLLGFGDITLSRYENGSLQDEAHDQLLKFVLQPTNLLSLIKEKPFVIPESKHEHIRNILDNEIIKEYYFSKISSRREADIFSGYKTTDFNRVLHLVKYFAYPLGVVKTKLMKLLFYSDFKAFKEFKHSLTGLAYAKYPYGPVPEGFQLLLGMMLEMDPSISTEMQFIGNYQGEVFKSSTAPKVDAFNDNEWAIIKDVQNRFEYFTSKDIKNFSHEEKAYQENSMFELIPYSYADELLI